MKKFINATGDMLMESLAGFAKAHADMVAVHYSPIYVTRAVNAKQKVALISGGGSGHEPLHAGFIGYGMLDAVCPGQVFTSPTPDQMLAAASAVDNGKGVLFIVKNYAGDCINFQIAAEMVTGDHATVIVDDDVAVINSTHTQGKRGVAGTVVVEKIVGAAAEAGADLTSCKALGERVVRNTASIGVALSSCTVPAAGRATFDLGEDEIEFGVGIHGEPGRRREKIRPADELVAEMVEAILSALKPAAHSRVLLLVNGFGGTPLMELYLLANSAELRLAAAGVTVVRQLVGNFTTALEMAGASITVTVLDDEMLGYWDSPVATPALRKGF